MKLSTLIIVGGLLSGSLVAGADPAAPPAEPSPDPSEAPAPAEQPAVSPKETDASRLEAAKKQVELDQQQAGAADGVTYRQWSPPSQPPAPSKKTAGHGSQFHPVSVTGSADQLYAAQWGVDALRVQYTSSGNLLRFTYRVVDPKLAAPLADKKFTPSLYSPKHHAYLSVPVMEKVGALRQAMGQKAGEEYWMAFSNQGQLVKPGERVNITVGAFHADGLRVE